MKPLRFFLTRSKIAFIIKIATVLSVTLAVYHQDLIEVGNEATRSELMSYMIAVPFIISYLVYRKRKMLRAVIPFETPNRPKETNNLSTIAGILLFLTSFFLYWYGSYTFTPLEYRLLALPISVAACILILFNIQTLKQLAFPIAFMFLLVPPPDPIIYNLGASLSAISSEATYNILKTFGFPVSLSTGYGIPTILITQQNGTPLSFAIDIACSGIYSLIGFLIFATFIAYIARTKLWKKAAIFITSLSLIYLLNVIRITTIILLGYYYGIKLAMQTFHLLGGWTLIFTGTLIMLTLSEKIFKIQFFTRKMKTAACNYCNENQRNKQHFCLACGKILNPIHIQLSKRDLSKIAALLISASLISFFIVPQMPVFALTQGPAEVIIQSPGGEQVSTQILPEISGYTVRFVYRDETFEEITQQDASLTYAYIPTDKSEQKIWVTIEIAKTRSVLHRWELCLQRVTQLRLRDVQLLQNPPITARYFAFHDIKSNITQVILYWYENALFNTGSNLEQKYVKISLIAFTNNPEDIPNIEDQLLPFGKAIANYWQPIKTWSQIALLISQNGITFIAITVALLATILSYQVIKNRGEKKSNLQVYNKLALKEEKLILQAAHEASKKEKPTANVIASHYQKLTGKTIDLELLLEKLNEAEKVGLIKRDITSQEDEPILTWKSQISFPEHNKLVKSRLLRK